MGTSFNIRNFFQESVSPINFFQIKKLSALCFTWLWLISLGSLILNFTVFNVPLAYSDVSGPGWVDVQGQAVTPEQAAAYYAQKRGENAQTTTALTVEENFAEEITTEIDELARGLNHNPKLIYEYVRNHVDYVPYYGSLKGATLTYLDGSGNDFDQASLMIALLRASGYDSQYIYGTLSIPASGASDQKDMQHWLGVTDDSSVISNILKNGGIPYTSGSNYEVDRVWVSATIDGTTYVFDPAFKVYETVSGIDLADAMGYDQTQLLSVAGGTVDTDGNYIQNLNENALGTQLTSYSTALFNVIRASYPNASMEEIIGGRTIVPEYLTQLPTSLEFTIISQNTPWDEIPSEYTHTINISYGDIDETLDIPTLCGKKLSVTYSDTSESQAAATLAQADNTDSAILQLQESNLHLASINLPSPLIGDGLVSANDTTTSTASFGSVDQNGSLETTLYEAGNSNSVTITVIVTLSSQSAFSLEIGEGTHSLASGASVPIRVKFDGTDQSLGTKTATLTVAYWYGTENFSNLVVSLTGTVTESSQIDFGQAELNSVPSKSYTMTNTSSIDQTIESFLITGDDSEQFDVSVTTGTWASGATVPFTISYLTSAVGTHSAVLKRTISYAGTYGTVVRVYGMTLSGETISPPTAQLWLDDELIASETDPGSGDNPDTMVLTIEHPYPDDTLRTWSGQVVEYPMNRGENYYVIIYDFGGSRDGRLLEKRQRKIKDYRLSGYEDESRQVLTETLNVMGMTWMRDTTLNTNLLNELSDVLTIRHHRFGVMAQESGYYIDVKAQKSSSVSRNNDSDALEARFKAGNFLDSALEHGVLEQMQVNRPAVSTVKLLQITNDDQDPVFLVTADNFDSIKEQLDYEEDQLTAFRTRVVNQGYSLILPANGQIALDSGSGEGWAGKGYIEYKNDDGSMSCGMIIGGDYYGGYVVVEATADAGVVDQKVTSNIQQDATQAQVLAGEPVDMTTGYWVSGKTDLALSGGMGGLAFKRTYFSGNHQIESELGYGWSHNCNLYAEVNSNTAFGLGQRLPTDSTALIAASVAIVNLMTGDTDIRDWMTAALTGKWAMDQLTDNAVNLHLESDILTYIKQPDSTFSLPPGVNAELILDSGQYRLEDRFDRTIAFDAENRVQTITDADLNTITFTYSDDVVAGVSDNFGHALTFEYTGDNLTSVTDSAGRTVTFGYTDSNLTTYTDPGGKVWTYGYDADHRVLTLEDPMGITTITNIYDSLGRVMTQTAPRQSGSATYNFYFSGYRNVEEDSQGNQTVYTYDRKNRLVATQDALGNQVTRNYDGQNHVTQSIDPRGNATTFTYDGNNNLIQVTDALSEETVNTYDAYHRLIQVADPLGNTVSYGYNDAHHLVSTTVSPSAGQTIETGASYYTNGLTETLTDGRGVVTTLDYDGYGNPATSQTASAPAITYDYDGIGQMVSLTDQGGSQTDFIYDGRGLLQTRTDPLLKTTQMAYYDDGKLYTATDRNGDTTTFTYTPSGKPAAVTYQDGTQVAFTYDLNDNLTAMQDSLGTTTYVYDEVNRLTSATNPNGFTVAYQYDEAGNLVQLTYPGNKTVSYTYDALNRLGTVTIDWLALTASYEYDSAGNLTGLTQFNGTYVNYNYDNANRLIQLEHLSSSTGSAFASYAFTLDANGNRTGIDQEAPLSPSLEALTTHFAVSAAGNRIVTAGDDSLLYDEEGQLITKAEDSFSFNQAHRLTEVATETDSLIFSYDGAGNRLTVDRNETVTRYIYDAAGNLLAEADTGGITRYYIHGAGLLSMVTSGGTPYCYHFDATGHTIALTDAGKTIVNKYAYTPFGIIAGQEETVEQPFKFVGQFGVMTEDNGWYYMRARYYDPEIGRFISEDPLGFGGGDVNLYAYCLNNPVMFSDPLGLWVIGGNFGGSITFRGMKFSLSTAILFDNQGNIGIVTQQEAGAGVGKSAGLFNNLVIGWDTDSGGEATISDYAGTGTALSGSYGPATASVAIPDSNSSVRFVEVGYQPLTRGTAEVGVTRTFGQEYSFNIFGTSTSTPK